MDRSGCGMQVTEKANLATKAKADVIISMLPLIDNFERASGQIKAETEQEQKIDAAYQVGPSGHAPVCLLDMHELPKAMTAVAARGSIPKPCGETVCSHAYHPGSDFVCCSNAPSQIPNRL